MPTETFKAKTQYNDYVGTSGNEAGKQYSVPYLVAGFGTDRGALLSLSIWYKP